MYHLKHQKTLRAITRANHKQAQSLAKRAKRLECKLTISVMFVSKTNRNLIKRSYRNAKTS